MKKEAAILEVIVTDPAQELADSLNRTNEFLDEIAEFYANEFCSASQLRASLEHLKSDHSNKTIAEIYKNADGLLAPGSFHTSGALIDDVLRSGPLMRPDPLLVAATMRLAWKGGKMGFVFLPNPAEADMDEYAEKADWILDELTDSWESDASYLLTNDNDGRDLDFYNSLPKHMTVYRGGHGITPERLAAGVCWTRSRAVAEWFACRGFGAEPVVISARTPKHAVATVFATEFEVVCLPAFWGRFRTLICRRKRESRKPAMHWKGPS